MLLDKCEEMSAPAFCYEYDYGIEKRQDAFAYMSYNNTLLFPMPALIGDHQLVNASAAISAIMLLNNRFKISQNQIAEGLSKTTWPGRIEKIDIKKYQHLAGSNVQIYLDGAHNESGARCLAIWAYENLSDPIYMIIGMSRNREVGDLCQYFVEISKAARSVHVCSEPSSYNADTLADKAKEVGMNICSSDSLIDAIRELSLLTEGKKTNIIITGSLFLVSDFYKLISAK